LAVCAFVATRFDVHVPHDADIALNAGVLFVCGWLGLRYWIPWRLWSVPAAAAALALVVLYFSEPDRYNNAVLATFVLGIAVGGYYVTKRFLRVFYGVMALYDAYIVWGSDIAERIVDGQKVPFPTSLIVGALNLPFLEISTLDAALAALAIIGIQRHRGVRRSVEFAVLCVGVAVGQAVMADMFARWGGRFELPSPFLPVLISVPLLVPMAPLVWLCLARPRRQSE
jgi:hypothetical protein